MADVFASYVKNRSGPAAIAALGIILTTPARYLDSVLSEPVIHLLQTLIALGTLASSMVCGRYVGVFEASGAPTGSLERRAYTALRKSVAEGGAPAKLYADWLTRFLDRVDRFFGDAGKADQTLFPHAFGLKTPAPLWTAPAFDRCLLLALFYPFTTTIVIRVISGHVGPAEAALGLVPNIPAWRRGLAFAASPLAALVLMRYRKSRVMVSAAVPVICVVAGVVAGVYAGASLIAGAVVGVVAAKPDGAWAEAMMRTLWIKILMAIDENIPGDLPAVVIWRIVFAIVMLALVLFVNWRLWLSSSHL